MSDSTFPTTSFFIPCKEDFQTSSFNSMVRLICKIALVASVCLLLSPYALALALALTLTLDGCTNLVRHVVSHLKVPPPPPAPVATPPLSSPVPPVSTAAAAPLLVPPPPPAPVATPPFSSPVPPVSTAAAAPLLVPPPPPAPVATPPFSSPIPPVSTAAAISSRSSSPDSLSSLSDTDSDDDVPTGSPASAAAVPFVPPSPAAPAATSFSSTGSPASAAVTPLLVPPPPAVPVATSFSSAVSPASIAGAPAPSASGPNTATAVAYVVGAEAMLAEDKASGPQALPIFKEITFQTEFPEIEWKKISEQELRKISDFQSSFTSQLATFFRGQGFLVNECRIPAGVNVGEHKNIDEAKKALAKTFKEKREWFTRLFCFLARMGMAGYADQTRTFLAGHLNITGKHVPETSPTAYISKKWRDHYPAGPRAHEDLWTEAIRTGNQDYQKSCVPRRQSLETTDQQVQDYPRKKFQEWNLELLGKNSAIRQRLLQDILTITFSSPEEGKDLLRKFTFLDSREGYKFCLFLQKTFPQQKSEFESIWEETVHLQQKSLGKEGEYLEGRRKARELFQNQKRLYEAFGKRKIHPQFFQPFLSSPATRDAWIQKLQQWDIIDSGADGEGYYKLKPEGSWKVAVKQLCQDKSRDSEEARVAHILQIAQGTIESRFAARRLAPTFYQSKVSNNNFDVPRDQLPTLLAHEDFRVALVEMEKQLFMQFLGIGWDEKRSQFIVAVQKDLQFITQMQAEDSVPLGPSVVSVFLDSIVSLGGARWANGFCSFLKQQQEARSIDTHHWDAAQDLNKTYVQATSQQKTSASFASTALTKTLPLLPAQELDYRNRRDTILQLFAQGELLVRVIELRELNDLERSIYEGKWWLSYGPNLSTTLIPRQGSSLNMNLFLDGIRGVLLNPHSVTESYFGMGFTRNAVTQTDNFWYVLRERRIENSKLGGGSLRGSSLSYVREELARESAEVEVGGRAPDRSHTEIAYFRPAERNLVEGLFFKVNDEKFTNSLRDLIALQKGIFDRFGILLPIFAYKDLRFQEVVVDEQLLKTLGIPNAPAVLRILDEGELARRATGQIFNIYGDLDTAIVLAGKSAMSFLPPPALPDDQKHYENFHKLFDVQLMILQLKSPSEKISFMMNPAFRAEEFVSQQFQGLKGASKQELIDALKIFDGKPGSKDTVIVPVICSHSSINAFVAQQKLLLYAHSLSKAVPTDLSILDNVHLIFPTISPTGNKCAEAQDLFFSHPDLIRFLRGNGAFLQCWIQMAKRNIRMFLGIEIQTDKSERVLSISINKGFLPVFRDSTDATGKKQFAKCVSRVIQMLTILDKKDWAIALKTECRKQLGDDFGKEGTTDYFTDGSQLTEAFMENLKNPNFTTPVPLPDPHGNQHSATDPIVATRTDFAHMQVKKPPSSGSSRAAPSASQPVGAKYSLELQRNAAEVLNRVYQRTWVSSQKSDFKKRRDDLVQRLLWMERDAYTPEHAVDLTGSQIVELERESAFANTFDNAESVRVVFRKGQSPQEIVELLTKTAVRSTNGDRDLLRLRDPSYHLLTDEERRRKRYSMVKVGRVTLTAKGGYNGPRERLEKPVFVHVVSAAAQQFEKYGMSEELDVADFIVKRSNTTQRRPLFPEWYAGGIIPSFQELQGDWEKKEKQVQIAQFRGEKPPSDKVMAHEDDPASVQAQCVRLRNGEFFLMRALRQSTHLYLKDLVLPAIYVVLQKSSAPLYLKATAIGAGFFASLGIQKQFQTSLRKYIIEALIQSYIQLIKEGSFPPGSVIEFPYYKLDEIPKDLLQAAGERKVEIVWQENRDVCDFSLTTSVGGRQIDPSTYTRFLLNPEDAFAFSGNESDPSSVDAMVGNNSDLRMVFNWHFNHLLLDPSRYIPV